MPAVPRAAIKPVFEAISALAGTEHTLSAARTVTAFLHGFVSMEVNRNFQLGGSVDRAFNYGLEAMLKGLRP